MSVNIPQNTGTKNTPSTRDDQGQLNRVNEDGAPIANRHTPPKPKREQMAAPRPPKKKKWYLPYAIGGGASALGAATPSLFGWFFS